MLPMYKQPKTAPRFSTQSPNYATLWSFPTNSLEPTTAESFIDVDPAGFFTPASSVATKTSSALNFGRASKTAGAMSCWTMLEPLHEPCTDEIPWSDLVFWLGNASTGEVICPCVQCGRQAMRSCNGNFGGQQRYSPYNQRPQQQQRQRVSSRVPVINLPRIEGVN